MVSSDGDYDEKKPIQVIPRRHRRQLNRKIRVDDSTTHSVVNPVLNAAKSVTYAFNASVENQNDASYSLTGASDMSLDINADGYNGSNNAGLQRRSRRSPRHLRVSGQRRYRYRDERYPIQSPVPLSSAVVSPEMASGKVWVSYPVFPIKRREQETITVTVGQNQETDAAAIAHLQQQAIIAGQVAVAVSEALDVEQRSQVTLIRLIPTAAQRNPLSMKYGR